MPANKVVLRITSALREIYPDEEAEEIAFMIIEELTGMSRSEQQKHKDVHLSSVQDSRLNGMLGRLSTHEPVQYVLGHCWFQGMKLRVDNTVLIPRPETEELVEFVLRSARDKLPLQSRNYKILDVGTGSGCIAISLKKKLPEHFEVWAVDRNNESLTIARKNADDQNALVDFIAMDFMDAAQRQQLPRVDVIVSNPPYVTMSEKNSMKENVVRFEPGEALFVPDDDPLIFYRAIIEFAGEKLNEGGEVFVEINESLGKNVVEFFEGTFNDVELRKDMQGKDRMVRAAGRF